MLNAISTGAMARLGKVYMNRMIDLIASNQKLVERAIEIISTISNIKDLVVVRTAYKSALEVLHPARPTITSVDNMELAKFACQGSVVAAVLILRGLNPTDAALRLRAGTPLREMVLVLENK